MSRNAFLICPVRGHHASETEFIVNCWEGYGYKVHAPHRDTNQDDPTGLQICKDNRQAIMDADLILVVWDGESQGCLFDLGMAFALKKRIVVLTLPPPTDGKSFQNMIRAWVDEQMG